METNVDNDKHVFFPIYVLGTTFQYRITYMEKNKCTSIKKLTEVILCFVFYRIMLLTHKIYLNNCKAMHQCCIVYRCDANRGGRVKQIVILHPLLCGS